jgi:Holliday junction resolvase
MKANKLESDYQAKILKYLKTVCYCVKHISSNRGGVPDITCCYKGRYVAFEVKRPGEELTMLQKVNARDIIQNGGYAFKVTTVEDVKKALASVFV